MAKTNLSGRLAGYGACAVGGSTVLRAVGESWAVAAMRAAKWKRTTSGHKRGIFVMR